jgi:hypothetical protein
MITNRRKLTDSDRRRRLTPGGDMYIIRPIVQGFDWEER